MRWHPVSEAIDAALCDIHAVSSSIQQWYTPTSHREIPMASFFGQTLCLIVICGQSPLCQLFYLSQRFFNLLPSGWRSDRKFSFCTRGYPFVFNLELRRSCNRPFPPRPASGFEGISTFERLRNRLSIMLLESTMPQGPSIDWRTFDFAFRPTEMSRGQGRQTIFAIRDCPPHRKRLFAELHRRSTRIPKRTRQYPAPQELLPVDREPPT